MSGSNEKRFELNMQQVKADLYLAETAIKEAESTDNDQGYIKYLKGLAGYHLQQAAEKLIKIQIYRSSVPINHAQVFRHSIQDLITYARTLNIEFYVPQYVDINAPRISSWEAEGRYDVHVVIRIDVLKKAFEVISDWKQELENLGY